MDNGPSAVKYLLVTTTGPAAEHQGEMFGLYRLAGTHNGAPYYVQLHDINTREEPGKIYKYKDGGWRAGDVLGGAGRGLQNSSNTAAVPETGRRYHYGGGVWLDDAGIRVTRVEDISPLLCGTITISATGEAARVRADCMGQFQPTGQFSAGRQVFHNQRTDKYLSVSLGDVDWDVRDSVDNVAGVASGCAPGLCPALRRAAVRRHRSNIKSWQYCDNDNSWHDAEITVKCSVHSNNTP